MTTLSHNLDPHKERYEVRKIILHYIRQAIEKGSGMSIEEMRKQYSEDRFFYEALKHLSTTKKALCEAIRMPVENACRYKRYYERAGLLWEVTQTYCPFTRHLAWTITTDPKRTLKSPPTPSQTSLLDHGV